eukprot:bmy_10697T0
MYNLLDGLKKSTKISFRHLLSTDYGNFLPKNTVSSRQDHKDSNFSFQNNTQGLDIR